MFNWFAKTWESYTSWQKKDPEQSAIVVTPTKPPPAADDGKSQTKIVRDVSRVPTLTYELTPLKNDKIFGQDDPLDVRYRAQVISLDGLKSQQTLFWHESLPQQASEETKKETYGNGLPAFAVREAGVLQRLSYTLVNCTPLMQVFALINKNADGETQHVLHRGYADYDHTLKGKLEQTKFDWKRESDWREALRIAVDLISALSRLERPFSEGEEWQDVMFFHDRLEPQDVALYEAEILVSASPRKMASIHLTCLTEFQWLGIKGKEKDTSNPSCEKFVSLFVSTVKVPTTGKPDIKQDTELFTAVQDFQSCLQEASTDLKSLLKSSFRYWVTRPFYTMSMTNSKVLGAEEFLRFQLVNERFCAHLAEVRKGFTYIPQIRPAISVKLPLKQDLSTDERHAQLDAWQFQRAEAFRYIRVACGDLANFVSEPSATSILLTEKNALLARIQITAMALFERADKSTIAASPVEKQRSAPFVLFAYACALLSAKFHIWPQSVLGLHSKLCQKEDHKDVDLWELHILFSVRYMVWSPLHEKKFALEKQKRIALSTQETSSAKTIENFLVQSGIEAIFVVGKSVDPPDDNSAVENRVFYVAERSTEKIMKKSGYFWTGYNFTLKQTFGEWKKDRKTEFVYPVSIYQEQNFQNQADLYRLIVTYVTLMYFEKGEEEIKKKSQSDMKNYVDSKDIKDLDLLGQTVTSELKTVRDNLLERLQFAPVTADTPLTECFAPYPMSDEALDTLLKGQNLELTVLSLICKNTPLKPNQVWTIFPHGQKELADAAKELGFFTMNVPSLNDEPLAQVIRSLNMFPQSVA